jgi:hypothetical protein
MKHTIELFVYNAGATAVDPPRVPSLTLLPPRYLTFANGWPSSLHAAAAVPTGAGLLHSTTSTRNG